MYTEWLQIFDILDICSCLRELAEPETNKRKDNPIVLE